MSTKSFFQHNSAEVLERSSIQELQQRLNQKKQNLVIAKTEHQKAASTIEQILKNIAQTETKCMAINDMLLSCKQGSEIHSSLAFKKQRYESRVARDKLKITPLIAEHERLTLDIEQFATRINTLQTHLTQRKADAFHNAIAQAMQQQHPY